jgi:hypothetical protein
MEAFFHDNDSRAFDAVIVAMQTRNLDRSLIGFRAGIAEKGTRQAGKLT